MKIIERIKETNLEKFGVEWSFQNEDVKEKIKQTNLERYGVKNPSSSQIVKDIRENTLIEKYGVSNVFQAEEIKDKIKRKYVEKYGVEYPTQIEEIRKKIDEIARVRNYKQLSINLKYLNNVEILFTESEYLGSSSEHKYKVKCKKCNNIFEDHFDGDGHPRCLICYPYIAGFSYAEKEILEYIKKITNNNSDENFIISRNRSVLGNRELDIYIPSLKLAIEYNGLFWHSECGGGKDRNYHIDKMNRCNEKGIRLIQIFEDEWSNKKEIIENKLKYVLGVYDVVSNRVYARKCEVNTIPSKLSVSFLDKNHIQGSYDNSSINIGLFYNNYLLVSVMTFGKLRVSLGNKESNDGEYELLRYATSELVIGGAGKLLSYFIKTYKPSKIVSYADRRWSVGNLYEKVGFNKISSGAPNYWYFQPGYAVRYHRFGFRKNILHEKLELFDPMLTEWENMELNGWDRIWDCGNLKYEWVK